MCLFSGAFQKDSSRAGAKARSKELAEGCHRVQNWDVLYGDRNYGSRSSTATYCNILLHPPCSVNASRVMSGMFVQPLRDTLGEFDFLSRKW